MSFVLFTTIFPSSHTRARLLNLTTSWRGWRQERGWDLTWRAWQWLHYRPGSHDTYSLLSPAAQLRSMTGCDWNIFTRLSEGFLLFWPRPGQARAITRIWRELSHLSWYWRNNNDQSECHNVMKVISRVLVRTRHRPLVLCRWCFYLKFLLP